MGYPQCQKGNSTVTVWAPASGVSALWPIPLRQRLPILLLTSNVPVAAHNPAGFGVRELVTPLHVLVAASGSIQSLCLSLARSLARATRYLNQSSSPGHFAMTGGMVGASLAWPMLLGCQSVRSLKSCIFFIFPNEQLLMYIVYV